MNAQQKIIKIYSSSLCTCLHHMVILRTRNKITDFFMILAWASPFKLHRDNVIYILVGIQARSQNEMRRKSPSLSLHIFLLINTKQIHTFRNFRSEFITDMSACWTSSMQLLWAWRSLYIFCMRKNVRNDWCMTIIRPKSTIHRAHYVFMLFLPALVWSSHIYHAQPMQW